MESRDRGTITQNRWLIWVLSFGLWTFVALANGLTIFQFDRSVGRPMSLRDEITLQRWELYDDIGWGILLQKYSKHCIEQRAGLCHP